VSSSFCDSKDWCDKKTEVEYNSRNIIACSPQSWDWLEDWEDKDDKMT